MDYQSPRIAEIYDAANPLAEDGGFYLAVAGDRPCQVLDLGCGTGTLCSALTVHGHRVTGIDPAAAMLDVARRKPHAEKVEWVESTAQLYRSQKRFDLIVMTGHAFQTLLADEDILATFETMRLHLKPDGTVAFETRNPQVDWASEWQSRQRLIRMPNGEQVVETLEVTGNPGEFISFRTVYRSAERVLNTNSTLRFPSREHVEALLARSGLVVMELFGDWEGSGFHVGSSREMIFRCGLRAMAQGESGRAAP
jgi:2-polyprenyl-3-methyl-5-hydroxy-6-metoxy-1,4-benzoquinol methylase